jgi:hypothetical protein
MILRSSADSSAVVQRQKCVVFFARGNNACIAEPWNTMLSESKNLKSHVNLIGFSLAEQKEMQQNTGEGECGDKGHLEIVTTTISCRKVGFVHDII